MNLVGFSAFEAWCKAQSIQTCLEIQQDSAGYRYASLKNDDHPDSLKAFSPLLQVPIKACLTAPSSEELADQLQYHIGLVSESPFHPYLNLFPASFEHLPRYWSRDLLLSIPDGGLLYQAAMEDDELRLGNFPQLAWELAVVDSRSHFLPNGDYSLTPVLDMMNHDAQVETRLRVKDDELLTLSVHDPVWEQAQKTRQEETQTLWSRFASSFQLSQPSTSRRPNEICISYGKLTNVQTMLQYGFCAVDNPYNLERLRIRLRRRLQPLTISFSAEGTLVSSLSPLRKALATTEERDLIQDMQEVAFVSYRNEDEVQALVLAELQVAMDQARQAIATAGGTTGDKMISVYLEERANTLQRALTMLEQEASS
jgi:hypothetical protein